ncbi:MAG: purine-nucleoside phosphorylase [Rhizobiales bacterium]|nr:purine-nucleoside phosphorylase [Hyphomicrobiales bacterium]
MRTLSEHLGAERPKIATILGSSLGDVAAAAGAPRSIAYGEIAGFPVPKVSGHAGELIVGTLGGRQVLFLRGRAHAYENGNAAVMRPAISALAESGVTTLIVTNAAGSLDPKLRPGSIMLIEDHINFSGMNPLIGETGDQGFVGMTEAYDPALRMRFLKAAKQEKIALAQGVYVWFSGPSFETPAEIRMVRQWGGDAVGMSTVPEVILARRFGLRVAALSIITNLGAGIEGAAPSHDETKREGAKAAADMTRLLESFMREAGDV